MFGALLRRHRRSAGLTQEELAERSGLSVRAISDLERSRTARPYRSSAELLARALGLGAEATSGFVRTARGGTDAVAPNVPRQLPAAPPHFTGRADESKALDEHVDAVADTVVVAAIRGMPGIGKTALAMHWAHQVAERFPDGQIYVNLCGFDPSGSPMPPEHAIRRLLIALGVLSERVPADVDAAASLYRSVLAGKRLLIVLDNARDAAQVRPLIPGSPGCMVLATSRHTLAGLVAEGARQLALDVLSGSEARDFLARRLGPERVAHEPDAVADLVATCGRLPLALAVIAARAGARPTFALSLLAAELRDTRLRLDALDAGDPATSVSAVFDWSYRQLSPDAARMFRLLGLHPGPDVSVPAAASLAGVPRDQAQRLLAELHHMHLLAEHLPGRYTFHDLVQAYAARLADADPQRHEAIRRMLDHYLHTAYRADQLTKCYGRPMTLHPPEPGVHPEEMSDRSHALEWLAAEDQALIAAVHRAVGAGFDMHAWQLARAVTEFLSWRGRWNESLEIQTEALHAAQRLGDRTGVAFAHGSLGVAYKNLDRDDEARNHLRAAHDLWDELGDRSGQGLALLNLSNVLIRQGDDQAALRGYHEALSLFESAGDRAGQARSLNNIGWQYALLGEPARTLEYCQQAIAVHQEIGDRDGAAYAWDSLGYAHDQLAHHAEAIACYQKALDMDRGSGNFRFQATVLDHLGDTHAAAGEPESARDRWQQAADILEDMQHPDAEQIRAKLAGV